MRLGFYFEDLYLLEICNTIIGYECVKAHVMLLGGNFVKELEKIAEGNLKAACAF